MKKSAIITGATGFIGSWLTKELLKNGYEVTLLVRNKDKINDEITSRCLVIDDEVILLEWDKKNYDLFYHLAWNGVSSEQKNDCLLQIDNILLAVNAMKLARKLNVKKFIVSGTVAEYVFCDDIINCNARQTPNDFYGAAKVSAHYFLDVLSRQIGQAYIYAVLPSTYGEGRQDNNIITYTIKTLLKNEKPIYGDLEQLWDFVYVSDVVRALRLLGEKGIAGKTYGIGSGSFMPLKYYIKSIRDIIDPDLPLGIGEKAELSKKTFSSCVDTYNIVKDVGFRPIVTFDEGIKRMIKFFENRGDYLYE